MRLILPKTHPVLEEYRNLPLFFLAGPIQGGGDWHVEMFSLLMQKVGDCIIVNPSRYEPHHPHYQYRMEGLENHFERQTDWERYYLEQAAERWPTGCIIFWLPWEDHISPRKDGLPYAMDTRGEIGEWRGRMMYAPHLRVVMGAEETFHGLSQIKRNFELVLPNFKVYETMEEVVDRARFFAHPALSFETRVSA